MLEEKDTRYEVHISVRNLVEFIFREGDIDNRGGKLQSPDAMLEGSRIHRKIQKSMGTSYQAEVPLKYVVTGELYRLTIDGRADGIFTEASLGQADPQLTFLSEESNADAEDVRSEITWVDEIKGIYRRLDALEEPVYVHKAQAMCYAYIFAQQNSLGRIGVQMTYCNLDTEEQKVFREIFSFEDIEHWFHDLIGQYKKWADFQFQWKENRQASIKTLEFPYEYREGQKKLVQDVYRTILRKKNLFLQAPTGVGKTISTIFPAVKAVGEGLGDRIFYLTAKTITAAVAKETFGLLRERGYRAKVIQITAKEKLCMCEEMDCNPIHCPYAKGHYDRVNDAVFDLLQKSDVFTREEILSQAETYRVCPFEMSLDVASFADDIVCDYNYVFDPNVYLKRFFQEGIKGDYIFLVDEAHNLVERSRQMYSARLYKEEILSVKRLLKPYSRRVERQLEKCNRILLEYKRQCQEYQVLEDIGNLYFALMRLLTEMEELLQHPLEIPGRREILDFYFELRHFVSIYELVDEHYVVYDRHTEDGGFMIKLFCVDPSANLQKCIDRGNATVFFSATLLPIKYYKSLLSTKEDNYAIYARSVFSPSQRLLLFGRDVSTKYTRRNEEEFQKIAAYIWKTVRCRNGNYMVFFPSYKLMEQVYERFRELDGEKGSVRSAVQKAGMNEQEREEFLALFETERDHPFAAFCVMGGIFGEGIDLKNDRLIGAIVVGTGLPQISREREILKNYYEERSGCGFDYAYRYPGINKVLQAAGRVIRTTEDRGIILLLDERFLSPDYHSLYPREWEQRAVCSLDQVEQYITKYWSDQNNDYSS